MVVVGNVFGLSLSIPGRSCEVVRVSGKVSVVLCCAICVDDCAAGLCRVGSAIRV